MYTLSKGARALSCVACVPGCNQNTHSIYKYIELNHKKIKRKGKQEFKLYYCCLLQNDRLSVLSFLLFSPILEHVLIMCTVIIVNY